MQYKTLRINYFTFIFILFSIVSYHFKSVLIGYFISFIHECGHIICAHIFGLKKVKIEVLPIGCYAFIQNIDSLENYKQILIFLSGPMMFFPLYLLNNFLYELSIFSFSEYNLFNFVNKSVLFFNLMPFYPFDGGRIIDVILASYIDEKIVLIIRIITNFVVLIAFVFIQGLKKNILISLLLVICLINQIVNLKQDYKRFLIKRLISRGNKKKSISSRPRLIRERNNFFIYQGKIYDETYIIKKKLYEIKGP